MALFRINIIVTSGKCKDTHTHTHTDYVSDAMRPMSCTMAVLRNGRSRPYSITVSIPQRDALS